MPTFSNDSKMTTTFMFNHIIARFVVPKEIVTDHGSHFQYTIMTESTSLGFKQKHSSPYYPQGNGQVEVVNKSLNIMLQKIVDKNLSNWHIMLYPKLWAYRTSVKIAIGFTPFQLVYGIKFILPIECEIPSMKLVIDLLPDTSYLEKRLIYLEQLDEICRDATTTNGVHKWRIKEQYDKKVKTRVFSEGDLVLVYNQKNDTLGEGKFVSMRLGPYIVKHVLGKGAYELIDYEGNTLK